eukprot:4993403-Pyramimonas_sp.AAC.1
MKLTRRVWVWSGEDDLEDDSVDSHVPAPAPFMDCVVHVVTVYRFPSYDWFSRWVYTASPPAVGSHAG